MYIFLQQYWWLIVSLLGAILVFLLFVHCLSRYHRPDAGRDTLSYRQAGAYRRQPDVDIT